MNEHTPMKKKPVQTKVRPDAEAIAYQNKDVASKVTGEALLGSSLAPFGLPHIRIVNMLPTNLPAIESNELRLDNLFLLADEAVAIIDYESGYSRDNFVKYLNYAARIVKRYSVQKRLPQLKRLRIIVIYTADVETAPAEYDLEGVTVRVEPAQAGSGYGSSKTCKKDWGPETEKSGIGRNSHLYGYPQWTRGHTPQVPYFGGWRR